MAEKILRFRMLLGITLVTFFCFHSSVFGQTVSGTIQGRVVDSNGASIPQATILIKNTETGQERTLTSNEEGIYNAPFLPIGQIYRSKQLGAILIRLFDKILPCP